MAEIVNVKLRGVPPELYNSVIAPTQRVRRLSHLIITLLEGFRDDPYIRQYVEGEHSIADDGVRAQLLREIHDLQVKRDSLTAEAERDARFGASTATMGKEFVAGFANPTETSFKAPTAGVEDRLDRLESLMERFLSAQATGTSEPAPVFETVPEPTPVFESVSEPMMVVEDNPFEDDVFVIDGGEDVVVDDDTSPADFSFDPPQPSESSADTEDFDRLTRSLFG